MTDKQKVLIISHNSLSLHSNNGKTLGSMFENWGSNDLAQLFFQEEVPETMKFVHFFRIRDIDILKTIFSFGIFGVFGGPILPLHHVESHYSSAGVIKKFLVNYLRKFDSFKLILRDLIYGTQLWNSRSLNGWIESFSPDVVFFVGGNSIFSFLIANKIAAQRRIPLDIYITDDYILNADRRGFLKNFMVSRLVAMYNSSFSSARNVFVIGSQMANVFSNNFRRDFIPIMNSVVFPQESSTPTAKRLSKMDTCDIVYAGGLHLGRDISLIDFGRVIAKVSKSIDTPIKLTVYSLDKPSVNLMGLFSEVGIVFGGRLNQIELCERLRNSHFVLHVESFDIQYVNKTKLSVSTKLPEYLSSGSCLIAYGPSDLASVKLVQENSIGLVLSELDTDQTCELKLSKAIIDYSFRYQLVRDGYCYARKNFDAAIVRKNFEFFYNT